MPVLPTAPKDRAAAEAGDGWQCSHHHGDHSFSARNQSVPTRENHTVASGATANNPSVQVRAEGRPVERTGASEVVSKRSAEIRAEAQERFQEVQAQIRPLLSEKVPPVAKAQKLLDERRGEVLKTKVLTLGEGLFSGSGAAEAERKLVLEALDRELSVLSEQKKLLSELKAA
jgi:hypothetical protein